MHWGEQAMQRSLISDWPNQNSLAVLHVRYSQAVELCLSALVNPAFESDLVDLTVT